MSSRLSNRSRVLSVLAAIVPAGAASAQEILIDDFNDGNDDGWVHWVADPTYPGAWDASSGSYCLSTTDVVPRDSFTVVYAQWEDSLRPGYSEGALRAVVRAMSPETHATLAMRWDIEAISGYAMVADVDDGALYIIRVTEGLQEVLGFSPSAFTLDEDWMFEVSAIGAQITFKVWRVGTLEPEPQVVVDDTKPFATGGFGVAIAHGFAPSRIAACFDDVEFLPACAADFNLDGAPNSQDFFDFLAAFFALEPRADFNNDTHVNSQDFFDFLTAFFAGCP